MTPLNLIFALLALALLYTARPAQADFAHVTRIQVKGAHDLWCNAYFHSRREGRDGLTLPIVLSLKGTGIYTTSQAKAVELPVRQLFSEGRVTVLTLDKPGIEPDGQTPLALTVNDGLYNRYVQEDLVRCAANALNWAAAEAPVGGGPLFFSGHSEGAQIAIRLLLELTRRQDPLAARVKALFISGLPMADWRKLLSLQLSPTDRSRFFLAFERRDDAVLRAYGNLSYAYLQGVFAQEPLWQSLEELARLGTTAELLVYQGLFDRNTPVGPVKDYEAHNRQRLGQGVLRFTARYYRAGHGLNLQALQDIARDLNRHLSTLAATPSPPGPAITPAAITSQPAKAL